jgi:hypothetical protein
LLHQHPQTPLRAFALYRLGWAYRNAGVSGLPREDGDAAFRELLAHEPVWPSRALVEQARSTPWKSKGSAAAWSLLPGAGQIYVGEIASGIARLSVALASAAAILVPTVIGFQRRNELSWKHDWPLLVSGTAGVIALSIDYTLSYQDAIRAVVDFNERREQAFELAHPDAP